MDNDAGNVEKVEKVEKVGDTGDAVNGSHVMHDLEYRALSESDRVLSRLTSEVHDLIPPEPKRGPLSTAFWWWLSWAIPGLGMFTEAYFLFAIGNIEPLLAILYPNCW